MGATSVDRIGNNLANGYFIPEKFSAKVQKRFYAESVANAICTTDWEGDLHNGGRVLIRKEPDIPVSAHVEGSKHGWMDVNDEAQWLYINYAFKAAVKTGPVDLHQMDIDVREMYMNSMAKNLRKVIDTTVISGAYTSAGTTKTTGAVAAWNTTGNMILALGETQAVLSANDCPPTERWFLMHPAMLTAFYKEAGLYAANAGSRDGAMQRGFVMNLAGFDIYTSSLVPGAGTSGSPYLCMAGHKSAIALATQFTEFETNITISDEFGKGFRAINAFGYKVIDSNSLVGLAVQL